MTVEEPLLLRYEEAAKLLGLSRSTIYVLVNAGDLPVTRIGGAVRIARRDLEWFIEAHREES